MSKKKSPKKAVIKTRAQLIREHSNVYNWYLKNNPEALDKVFPRRNTYWSEESLKAEALKYKTRNEFYKGSGSAYQAALRLKLMDELFPKKLKNK